MAAELALGSTAAVIALVAAGIAARPEDEATAQRALEAAQAHLEAVKAKNNKPPAGGPGGEPPPPEGDGDADGGEPPPPEGGEPPPPPPPPGLEPKFSRPECNEVFDAALSYDLVKLKELFTRDPSLALCKKNDVSAGQTLRHLQNVTPDDRYIGVREYLKEAHKAAKAAEAAAAAAAAAAAEAERKRLEAEAAAAAEAERKRLEAEAAAAAEAERKRLEAEAAAAAGPAGINAATKLQALEKVAAALQPGPDKDKANANVAREKARLQRYNEEEAARAEYHRRHAAERPARVAAGTATPLTPEQLAAISQKHAAAAAKRQRRRAAGEDVPTPGNDDEPFTPRAGGGRRRVLTFRRKPKSRSKNGRRPTRKSSVRRNR
jgi:hypothetical protein